MTISVLANDGDVDGDTLSVDAVTQGTNGSAAIEADGTLPYTPGPDFNGSDSFGYTISDGNGGTDTATVEVSVEPSDQNFVEQLGTSRNDLLLGRPGQMDAIFGFRGNDWIIGFSGDDLFVGGSGNDRLLGGAGDDILFDGTGNDRVYGGAGNDHLLFEGGQNDFAYGGRGVDTFTLTEEMLNDGTKGRVQVLDYTIGLDQVDIGGAEIVSVKATNNGVRLVIVDDRDVLVLGGRPARPDRIRQSGRS